MQVSKVRERLGKVRMVLKRFRQAVLAAACSGRLTADWRDRHARDDSADKLLQSILLKRRNLTGNSGGGRYRKPLEFNASPFSEAPEGWVLASMDQLTSVITSGSRGWAKYYAESGAIFIRAKDINTDQLNLDDIAHVNPPSTAEGRRTRVRFDDLLITITGANVTKSALVDRDLGEAYVSQHVALVRPVDTSIKDFLFFWTISPSHGRAKLLADAYGAGKPGLNLDNIREVIVALPPLAEQLEIIRRVRELFKLADAIEKRVATATAQADKLTQAILAKVFRGELVPTQAELARREGRSYETGVELLKRVKSTT